MNWGHEPARMLWNNGAVKGDAGRNRFRSQLVSLTLGLRASRSLRARPELEAAASVDQAWTQRMPPLWVAVVAPFRVRSADVAGLPFPAGACHASDEVRGDELGRCSAPGAGDAAFDVDAAEAGRVAVRALGRESLGHLHAETADGACTRRRLVGAIVGRDDDGSMLAQQSFGRVAELVEVGDVRRWWEHRRGQQLPLLSSSGARLIAFRQRIVGLP